MDCDFSGTLWVVGGFSTIISSRDAGANWDSFSLDDDIYLTTIQFVDNQHGFVTGEFGTVLTTGDGGTSWQEGQYLPNRFYPQAASFIDAVTGWVVGLNGTIWSTRDGARSWQRENTGSTAPLYGVATVGTAIVVVGDNATVLYRRATDTSWQRLDEDAGKRTYLRAVASLGEGQFVAAGGSLFTGSLPRS